MPNGDTKLAWPIERDRGAKLIVDQIEKE